MKRWLIVLLILLTIPFVVLLGIVFFFCWLAWINAENQPADSLPTPEQLRKSIACRAYYDSDLYQANFTFRAGSTFDLNWTGAFGFDRWWKGTWTRQGDTVRLRYVGKVNERLGKTLLLNQKELIPLDSIQNKAFFTVGDCKGLN